MSQCDWKAAVSSAYSVVRILHSGPWGVLDDGMPGNAGVTARTRLSNRRLTALIKRREQQLASPAHGFRRSPPPGRIDEQRVHPNSRAHPPRRPGLFAPLSHAGAGMLAGKPPITFHGASVSCLASGGPVEAGDAREEFGRVGVTDSSDCDEDIKADPAREGSWTS